MYKNENIQDLPPQLMGADTLIGNDVYSHEEEDSRDIR